MVEQTAIANHVAQMHDRVWKAPEQRSWLEVEMDETCTLLRKKLEQINEESVDHLDKHDVWEIKNIYKTMWYIKQLRMIDHA